MELLILLGAVAVVVAVVLVVVAASRRKAAPAPAEAERRERAALQPGETEVTLPVDDADPDNPATKRMVIDAAGRALAADPEVRTVIVSARGGRELGRVERSAEGGPKPFVDVPRELEEPHAPRHAGPGEPVGTDRPGPSASGVRFEDAPRTEEHRTLADRFELPAGVRQRVGNPEDLVEIVQAILEEAGVGFDADGNVFRRGDQAVVVLRTPPHTAVDTEDLNAAFMRFERSGAKRGAVLTAGTLFPHEVRRRESLAPTLSYVGQDGVQRMADAVSMGADPLDFVVLRT